MVHDINNVVIAGAGIMGSSIAQLFAAHEYNVILYDISEEALEKSSSLISVNQAAAMEAGELDEEKAAGVRRRITFSGNKECFQKADFVIEAIIEKMEIKHGFWKEISDIVPETAVLTSNTSGLSLRKLQKQ